MKRSLLLLLVTGLLLVTTQAQAAGKLINGIDANFPPFAFIDKTGQPSGFDVEAVMPVRAPVAVRGRVAAIELAGGPAVLLTHVGPYDQLMATYATLERWLAEHHRTRSDAVREVYLTNPADGRAPADWVTQVIQPVAPA